MNRIGRPLELRGKENLFSMHSVPSNPEYEKNSTHALNPPSTKGNTHGQ